MRRSPPIPLLLAAAALAAAAAAPSVAASPRKKTPAYFALDSGGLVPLPSGYRAISKPTPLDPESQAVALFADGDPQAALRAAEPADGRILVQVFKLSPKERADADFARHLEADLRAKAAGEPDGASVRRLSGTAYRSLLYRGTAPALYRVYLFAPEHLVIVSARHWEKAVADIAKGYRDAP